MSQAKVLRFGGPAELAQSAAQEWLKLTRAAASNSAPLSVALSGGRIAGRFFTEVAQEAKQQRQSLSHVEFFWSDERCVPPDHPESNFRLARENLFDVLQISSRQIHRVRGEAEPAVAAAEAEGEVRQLIGKTVNGQPVLDLVLLGMGEDGHVASLFPGEPEQVLTDPAVFRPVTGPKPPPKRITFGYPALAVALRVWVLASGPGKEQALHQSLTNPDSTPLARVLHSRQHTCIFTDLR